MQRQAMKNGDTEADGSRRTRNEMVMGGSMEKRMGKDGSREYHLHEN